MAVVVAVVVNFINVSESPNVTKGGMITWLLLPGLYDCKNLLLVVKMMLKGADIFGIQTYNITT